jgi:hypothetical protein
MQGGAEGQGSFNFIIRANVNGLVEYNVCKGQLLPHHQGGCKWVRRSLCLWGGAKGQGNLYLIIRADVNGLVEYNVQGGAEGWGSF